MFCGFCWWCMQEIKSLKIWLRKGGTLGKKTKGGRENKFICYRLQVYDGILCVQHVNKSYVIYPFLEWLLLWASSCFCFHNVIHLRHGKKSSFYCSHQFFKFNFLRTRVAESFFARSKVIYCKVCANKSLISWISWHSCKKQAHEQGRPSLRNTFSHPNLSLRKKSFLTEVLNNCCLRCKPQIKENSTKTEKDGILHMLAENSFCGVKVVNK